MLRLNPDLVCRRPFPHLFQRDVLDTTAYHALRDEFPSPEWFPAGHDHGRRDFSYAQYGPSRFDDFIAQSAAWGDLFGYVRSPQAFDDVTGLFRPAMDEYGYLDGPLDRPDFSLSIAESGYTVRVHHDRRYHIAQFLLYFVDDEVIRGGDVCLYEPSAPKALADYERCPEEGTLRASRTYRPEGNSALVWLNTGDSYHGVTRLEGVRRFLYVAFNSASHSAWPLGRHTEVVVGDNRSPYRSGRDFIQTVRPANSPA
ncbi:MAG TPA: 2OG-Fe(II) oxygenase [Urbifossiella sp.]|nr:2OG-Fe(II) oxygenase [Urbifossiella sp.]